MPTTALTSEILPRWTESRPDHPALRWEGGELSYRELDARASQVANALRDSGIGSGDHVAYLDRNGPELVELFFGAAKINAVPSPVNFRLTGSEVLTIIADCGARLLVIGEEFAPIIDSVTAELPHMTIIVIGSSATHSTFAEWRSEMPAETAPIEQAPDDVAFLLYSSGTTGRPKGVQLTQTNLAVGLSQYPELMGLGEESINLVAMPMFHIAGGGWLVAGLMAGATNVLVREPRPADLQQVLERERVTHAFLVPAVLQAMLAVPNVHERDFSSLTAMFYGASPIAGRTLVEAIEVFGCNFYQGYGLTETTGTVVALAAADHDPHGPNVHRLQSAGRAIPGAAVRIVDTSNGHDVSVGGLGEIWIKGPTVMKGYWNMPQATAEVLSPDGWFRSGDIGYLDADGYLYLYDRAKDVIVSGGENVYPSEVETVLMAHPAVREVAVIGVPDEVWGETPKAVVVRDPGADATATELLEHCHRQLAKFKCPTSVEWAESLPRNASGKILKRELRAPFWEGRDRLIG